MDMGRAIAALTAENFVGKAFDIASPQAVTGTELVGMLSEKLNREVRFTPLSPAEFGAGAARVYGEEAGRGIAALYEATAQLPPDGAVINLDRILSCFR